MRTWFLPNRPNDCHHMNGNEYERRPLTQFRVFEITAAAREACALHACSDQRANDETRRVQNQKKPKLCCCNGLSPQLIEESAIVTKPNLPSTPVLDSRWAATTRTPTVFNRASAFGRARACPIESSAQDGGEPVEHGTVQPKRQTFAERSDVSFTLTPVTCKNASPPAARWWSLAGPERAMYYEGKLATLDGLQAKCMGHDALFARQLSSLGVLFVEDGRRA
ncbi:hypothetical protein CCMA1212_009150 [Trichoderma ghanense]|uniref:Uncharacterized protein n=1 Tax=Trichoderma ghanense TaxID=65468 RepID=A0ABY2GVP8_9HYPO